jgi:hypothetical protein
MASSDAICSCKEGILGQIVIYIFIFLIYIYIYIYIYLFIYWHSSLYEGDMLKGRGKVMKIGYGKMNYGMKRVISMWIGIERMEV